MGSASWIMWFTYSILLCGFYLSTDSTHIGLTDYLIKEILEFKILTTCQHSLLIQILIIIHNILYFSKLYFVQHSTWNQVIWYYTLYIWHLVHKHHSTLSSTTGAEVHLVGSNCFVDVPLIKGNELIFLSFDHLMCLVCEHIPENAAIKKQPTRRRKREKCTSKR